ncbi:MAG: hypothetical protein JWM34_2547 [Ilumatobacteraceae bacterium]|nr:hypothetical protein [Ilumatobacteraceae bacterium]
MSALDAVDHLVGMQAQAPFAPYYGLWCRLDGFRADDLGQLLVDRAVVRVVLMRGTVHLVTAADCLGLRPLVQPMLTRGLRTHPEHGRQLEGVDPEALVAATEDVLADGPLVAKELGERLAGLDAFADRNPSSLAHAARVLVPLIQVPPRAVWGRSGQPRTTTAAHWLGADTSSTLTIDEVAVRYLAAFGPASVSDFQTWCGLTRLREVVERIPGLVRFVDADGTELFDLADAPRPDADTVAPVRLLGDFDNVLLSHAKRDRIGTGDARRRLFAAKNGIIPGAVLVDGFVVGVWSIAQARTGSTVTVQPYHRLAVADEDAIVGEGQRLLELTGFRTPHDVRIGPVSG